MNRCRCRGSPAVGGLPPEAPAGAKGGGDGGIRTLDRPLQAYNGLANRRLQPLGHVSVMGRYARRQPEPQATDIKRREGSLDRLASAAKACPKCDSCTLKRRNEAVRLPLSPQDPRCASISPGERRNERVRESLTPRIRFPSIDRARGSTSSSDSSYACKIRLSCIFA